MPAWFTCNELAKLDCDWMLCEMIDDSFEC